MAFISWQQLTHVFATWGMLAMIQSKQSLDEVVAAGIYRHCLCHCMHYYSTGMRGFRWRAKHWDIAVNEVKVSLDYTHVLRTSAEWLQQVSAISYPPRVLKCSCKELLSYLQRDSKMTCNAWHAERGLEQWKAEDVVWTGPRWHTITDCGRWTQLWYFGKS